MANGYKVDEANVDISILVESTNQQNSSIRSLSMLAIANWDQRI